MNKLSILQKYWEFYFSLFFLFVLQYRPEAKESFLENSLVMGMKRIIMQ